MTAFLTSSHIIPATGEYIITILKLLGIDKPVKLFGAHLLDKRIIFTSLPYSHLYMSIKSFVSLIYPINFIFVNIPVSPSNLSYYKKEYNSYIVRIQYLRKFNISDLTNVLIMNLDTGLLLNEKICYPLIPEPYFFQNSDDISYRPCNSYARIVPLSVIKFHSDLFMNLRNNRADFYMLFFQTSTFIAFINERGKNYRYADYFDKVINEFGFRNDDATDFKIKIIHKIYENLLKN
ncbi:hypothetical protein MXB_1775 [Myxobolus squamalis]|nr:hypothetical protein MXB_1775 [Myxobolus squamalis]